MSRRALSELLALAAPPLCLACRASLRRADELLCPDCLRALPWLRGRRCPRFARPRHGPGDRRAARAAFSAAWSPMAYDGPARALVQALKLRAALPAVGLMAAQVVATMPLELRAGSVVPVPPQRARRRSRGFD